MKPPTLLYEDRTVLGIRIRRWGSRRIGVVVNYIDADRHTSGSLAAQVGRWCFDFGPAGQLDAGHASLPKGTRSRLWPVAKGRAFGLALIAREAVAA